MEEEWASVATRSLLRGSPGSSAELRCMAPDRAGSQAPGRITQRVTELHMSEPRGVLCSAIALPCVLRPLTDSLRLRFSTGIAEGSLSWGNSFSN